jgi:hypothetical protein
MKLLQVCGPLLMAIVLQLPLCLHELQGSVVCVDDLFLSQNVMLPLPTSLHNGIHFFVIASIADKPAKWNTFLCHKWDTSGMCQKVSHCDMPLDAHVE